MPFPAPSLRNPHFANPHFANPRALAPQSLRPFLRSLRNPHLLSFANRRIVSPHIPSLSQTGYAEWEMSVTKFVRNLKISIQTARFTIFGDFNLKISAGKADSERN